jgi:glycosyltransferase involved in cell wall biosynthesis
VPGRVMPKLLSINNYFYRRGGSEAVFLEHNRLFEDAGWSVVPFAMRGASDLPSPWAQHFAGAVDFSQAQSLRSKVAAASKIIYSFEARRLIRQLIELTRPDVAHAHNIYHHLSPSILVELRRQSIPVVMTLHDLKLACPAYKMFTHGEVCERCRDGALHNVILRRCIKGSVTMSAMVWLESVLHRVLELYQRNVTRFVVPSRFFLAKLESWGFDRARFTYVPNFVEVDALERGPSEAGPFVYCGRLVPEKGVATLIRAAARARVRLLVVGAGPEETKLRQTAEQAQGDVTFTGHLSGNRLREVVGSARAVVVPSEWYENAPISVMEASALGRAVIGARIGGIPELIREGETGFLFESANVESLSEVLARVQALPVAALDGIGRAGHAWMRAEFTPGRYRDRMLNLYRTLGVSP